MQTCEREIEPRLQLLCIKVYTQPSVSPGSVNEYVNGLGPTEVTAHCGRGLGHHPQHSPAQDLWNGEEHRHISNKLWEGQELVVRLYQILPTNVLVFHTKSEVKTCSVVLLFMTQLLYFCRNVSFKFICDEVM